MFFFRNPSTLNQAISFAEEFVSFNVQCLDVSREETVDDVPVEREVGDFDDQQSDLAEIVESLTEIERQVLALSERTGFVARSSAQCRGLSRKPRAFRPFVRYPSSTLSNCSSKRDKGKDIDVAPEKTEKCQKGVLGESGIQSAPASPIGREIPVVAKDSVQDTVELATSGEMFWLLISKYLDKGVGFRIMF